MKRLRNPRTGIDQGEVMIFSEFDSGGSMWTGQGERERVKAVRFSHPYARPPAVHVSVAMWDMDSSAALRGDLTAQNITESGFDIVFRTWSDSRVARLRAAWMAIGDLPHEDDWDVE